MTTTSFPKVKVGYTVDVYDLRLGLTVPKKTAADLLLTVNHLFPVIATLATIRAWAAARPIGLLRLFGHGAPGEVQIGKEEFSDRNVHLFSTLSGLFARDALLSLYACSPGEHLRPTLGNSVGPEEAVIASIPSFTKSVARVSGVHVLASRDLQYYHHDPVRFGRWEGRLYVVSPTGDVVRIPNLGQWYAGTTADLKRARLSDVLIDRLHDEVVKVHPDHQPPKEPTWRGMRF